VRLDGVRVLVVDDSEETLDLLVTVLGRYGAAVTTARDADGAIAALDRLDVDVLVCDISMPGKDGLALIGEMGRRRMVPALALTAHARPEDRAQALAAGFQRYFAKPVDPLELVRVLGALAGRGPTR
jgi:CheY-like chemotaxis protein